MACKKTKYTGRTVIVRIQEGCGDVLPAPLLWKILGSMRQKELTLEWETSDATADDSIGSLRENITTFLNASITGDGVCKAEGLGADTLKWLTKHVAAPVGGEPVAWVQIIYPDLTFTFFANVTNCGRSGAYDDVVTWSFEATATASEFGLIVEDTPAPDAPAVSSVVVAPDLLDLTVGQVYDRLQSLVLPASAPRGVIWSSSDPMVAQVNTITGVVTAVGIGQCTISATSTAPGALSGDCEVEVNA